MFIINKRLKAKLDAIKNIIHWNPDKGVLVITMAEDREKAKKGLISALEELGGVMAIKCPKDRTKDVLNALSGKKKGKKCKA